ncbi:MAG: hypothetical protein KAH25_11040 [Bacteroidales bacterium]|nr:hypothetical protein [Bacteroidales bacterium]
MKYKLNMSKFTLKENLNFWIIVFNSFVYYLLALFTVIVSSNFFALLLGSYNGFSGKLLYYGFVIYPQDGHWGHDDIALIFMFSTMFSLFFAILFERLYKWRMPKDGNVKLFFLWGYIIAITWFLGNIIVGAYSNFSAGSVMRILHLPMPVRIVISLAMLVLLFVLGRTSRHHVLISINMYLKRLHSDKNFWVVKAQLLFPAILGVITYFIFRTPHQADYQFRDALVHLTVFIFILGVFWGVQQPMSLGFKGKRKQIDFDYWALGLLLIVSVSIRLFLNNGYLI